MGFKKNIAGYLLFLVLLDTQAKTLDVRIAGFIPQSSLFREIYGSIHPSGQLEATWRIVDNLRVWSNLTYVHASGDSVPLEVDTHLHLIPLSAGLQALYFFNETLDIQAGAGIAYTFLKESNGCALSNNLNGVGGIFKFGFTKSHKRWRFSLFADYLLQKFTSPQDQKVITNGLFCGGALGVSF